MIETMVNAPPHGDQRRTDGRVLQWRKLGWAQALGPSGRPRRGSTAARNRVDI